MPAKILITQNYALLSEKIKPASGNKGISPKITIAGKKTEKTPFKATMKAQRVMLKEKTL